jgi:hypothetical protein
MTKGFVNHSIKFIGQNPEFNLLRYSVLWQFGVNNPITKSCKKIQKMYRQQLINVMDCEKNKLDLTYAANCPPCGFRANNRMRSCNNPKICPFCFVRRRLHPAYIALNNISAEKRTTSKVLSWKRILAYEEKTITNFSKTYGPHQMMRAHATVQALLPFVDENNNLQLQHMGVQVIDRDCQHENLIDKLNLSFHVENEANSIGIHKAIVFASRLPWLNLFSKTNTDKFVKLMDDFKKRKLMKINKYKGDTRGN